MSCRKNFLITESEKSHILSLYGLLSEQTENEKSMDIRSSAFFDSGYYSEKFLKKEELMKQIKSAILFLKKNNGKSSKITITASEDSNPNYDNEKKPSTPLGRGELAKLRAETMQKFLENIFKELIDKKELRAMPIFEPPKLLIGSSVDKSKDRYVNVNFTVSGSDYDCLNGLVIGLSYEKGMGSGHTCNNAIYDVLINGIKLTSTDKKSYATLNNGNGVGNPENPPILEPSVGNNLSDGKIGGFRRNFFVITPEIAKQLLKPNESGESPTSFTISLTCRNANDIDPTIPVQPSFNTGCHPDVGRMSFARKGVTPTSIDKRPPSGRGDTEVFVTIDACGNILNK